MKAFTLECPGRVVAGIALTDGAIALGAHPVNSKPVTIPVDPRARVEGGRLVEAPGKGVLVIIEPHAGPFGSWHLRAAQPAERWDAMIAAGRIPNALDRILAEERVRARFPHRQPVGWYEFARSAVPPQHDGRPAGVRLYGYLGEGEAMELRRRGRLDGTPSVFRVACADGALVVSDPRALAEARARAAWGSTCL